MECREFNEVRVSIHAPVGVRFAALWADVVKICVSIHAPVGVRPLRLSRYSGTSKFQSTHPLGGDDQRRAGRHHAAGFNPRTRWGATSGVPALYRLKFVSIHAPVGVRLSGARRRPYAVRFQSTHPLGCDGQLILLPSKWRRFNPRTRWGATPSLFRARKRLSVSIHAPVGVRRAEREEGRGRTCFNPRTRWGATCPSLTYDAYDAVSIHAPVGVRRWRPKLRRHKTWFQSTHPLGCDVYCVRFSVWGNCFNPRTRWGATAKILFFRFFLLHRCS